MKNRKMNHLACFFLLIGFVLTGKVVQAAIVTDAYHGMITEWKSNCLGIMDNAIVNLQITYDNNWLNKDINVLNIIDFYEQGARLSLQVGEHSWDEIHSENPIPSNVSGWQNSIPYLVFDKNNEILGFRTHWLGDHPDGWQFGYYQVYTFNNNQFAIDLDDYSSTVNIISGVIDFHPVPLPSSMYILLPSLFFLFSSRVRKK